MTTRREARLQKAEAQADPPVHRPVIEASTHEEAMAEIERRIANKTFDPKAMALIVPPTAASVEEWEARQHGDKGDAVKQRSRGLQPTR